MDKKKSNNKIFFIALSGASFEQIGCIVIGICFTLFAYEAANKNGTGYHSASIFFERYPVPIFYASRFLKKASSIFS